jgi:hypothetical protein
LILFHDLDLDRLGVRLLVLGLRLLLLLLNLVEHLWGELDWPIKVDVVVNVEAVVSLPMLLLWLHQVFLHGGVVDV